MSAERARPNTVAGEVRESAPRAATGGLTTARERSEELLGLTPKELRGLAKSAAKMLPVAAIGGAVAAGLGLGLLYAGIRQLERAFAAKDREEDDERYRKSLEKLRKPLDEAGGPAI